MLPARGRKSCTKPCENNEGVNASRIERRTQRLTLRTMGPDTDELSVDRSCALPLRVRSCRSFPSASQNEVPWGHPDRRDRSARPLSRPSHPLAITRRARWSRRLGGSGGGGYSHRGRTSNTKSSSSRPRSAFTCAVAGWTARARGHSPAFTSRGSHAFESPTRRSDQIYQACAHANIDLESTIRQNPAAMSLIARHVHVVQNDEIARTS